MIEIRKLKQLIQIMKDNDLNEMDLRDKDEQVTLKRGPGGEVRYMPSAHAVPPPASAPAEASTAPPAAERSPADEGLIEITSPMVGTFYSSPTPDADSFVKRGSDIQPDTVVCLIEAMKVFNEIKAEVAGKIDTIMVKNGDAVEFGQPLFLVKPS